MPSDITALYLFETDKELKQHPSYVAAKAGDVGSALRLVSDLALATIYGATARFTKEDIFVAPHAKEATGDNAIPKVFAEVCALVYQATTDTDIVQSTSRARALHSSQRRVGSRCFCAGQCWTAKGVGSKQNGSQKIGSEVRK